MFTELIKPMGLMSMKTVPSSQSYIYQIKWDGIRMLSFISRGTVRLQNRKLRDRTKQYPELQRLKEYLRGSNAILDGEVVVLVDEKPNFSKVLKRELMLDEKKIKYMQKVMPVVYVVFDILWLNNKDLTRLTFIERQEILSCYLEAKDMTFRIAENYYDGNKLFKWTKDNELEGIVAKEKNSAYLIGRKTKDWLKIKNRKDILCVVGGYSVKDLRPSALLLGIYLNNQLYYIGKASTGLSNQDFMNLVASTKILTSEKSAFINPPRDRNDSYHWFYPQLTVLIEFAEWTEDFIIRHPVIKGFTLEPARNAKYYEIFDKLPGN